MANDDTKISATEFYETVRKFPAYRVVGETGDSNSCVPLQFSYHDGSLGFYTDMVSTVNHRHAQCEEIIDVIGDTDDGMLWGDVLYKEHEEDPWEIAVPCFKATRDDSAKWIRIRW